MPQEAAEVNKSTSSDKNNLESADFLKIGSQELNDMFISVFEQSTTITLSSTSNLQWPNYTFW